MTDRRRRGSSRARTRRAAQTDPAQPREGAGAHHPDRGRRLLADPDARPFPHLAAGSVDSSPSRAGGRSSPSRAWRPSTTTTQVFHNARRSPPRSGRRRSISVGGTILPILIASHGRLRVRLARVPRAATGSSSRVIAMLVVPIQMALIPIFSLYSDARPLRHGARPDPLPHRVRASVRDLPAPKLLHRDPEGPDGGGAHRRRIRGHGSSCA